MARIATSCATWLRMSWIVRGGGAGAIGLAGLESRRTSAPRLLRLALLLRYTDMPSRVSRSSHTWCSLGICFVHATGLPCGDPNRRCNGTPSTNKVVSGLSCLPTVLR